jgi:predicted acetyltransferase
MNVQLQHALIDEMDVVANLMQLYSHDLSSYQPAPVDDNGLYGLGPYFDVYWSEEGRYPFLIRADDQLAGFAFVRKLDATTYAIAEFFIMRRFRRSGVGTEVARELFDKFRGRWEVAQMEKNLPAQHFWRTIIADYTSGDFSEAWSDTDPIGPMQVFSNL